MQAKKCNPVVLKNIFTGLVVKKTNNCPKCDMATYRVYETGRLGRLKLDLVCFYKRKITFPEKNVVPLHGKLSAGQENRSFMSVGSLVKKIPY